MDFREELPADEPTQAYRVWWCAKGLTATVRLLANPVWVQVHWINGRSVPCDKATCPLRVYGRHPRANWKGYAPACVLVRDMATGSPFWNPHTVELSFEAGSKLRGKECRDLVITLKREKALKAPIVLDFVPLKKDRQLPPIEPWDVRPVLYRMWGVDEPVNAANLDPWADQELLPLRREERA